MSNAPVTFSDTTEDEQFLFQPAILIRSRSLRMGRIKLRNDFACFVPPAYSQNLPAGIPGLELREQPEEAVQIRKKSIPFIVMTYPVPNHLTE